MIGQQPNLNRPWSDIIPDGCSCSWINYSEDGGWYRKSTNPSCSRHGWVEAACDTITKAAQ